MKESQLENKTAIATNDYVRMVDENGNSVKIKKDSFMAAIRDALPSIISDGETGEGSVLSIINGALKTRTDANLASVLRVVIPQNGSQLFDGNLNDTLSGLNYARIGRIYFVVATPSATNKPTDFTNTYCCVLQIFNMELCWSYWSNNDKVFFRFANMNGSGISAWREL